MNPKYSVVIPVYNRPDEVDELLQSLCGQTYQNFEVVVGRRRFCHSLQAGGQEVYGNAGCALF